MEAVRHADAQERIVGMARSQSEGVRRMLTRWEKIERIVFLLCIIVLMLDLLVWRPN
jgi:hypothetical protein